MFILGSDERGQPDLEGFYSHECLNTFWYKSLASSDDDSGNIHGDIFSLKRARHLHNMHFAMENLKSFVIVLLQSQILWQRKNAVGVINLEKLWVPPPLQQTYAGIPKNGTAVIAPASLGHTKVASWLCGVTEGRTCFVASSSAQRNCSWSTEAGKGNRLFFRLRTPLCTKQRET